MADLTFTWHVAKPEQLVVLPAEFQASTGEAIAFEDVRLAQVEVNANQDDISLENLEELLEGLPMKALDDEHKERSVCGVLTSGRVVDQSLYASGIIFAGRFPEIAEDIKRGRRGLSIEADIGEAICSVCGETFGGMLAYCEHLKARKATGAVRKMRKLKCVGAGITRTPAGTDTMIKPNSLTLFASIQEEKVENEPVVAQPCADCAQMANELAQVKASLATAEANLSQAQAEFGIVLARSFDLLDAGFSAQEVAALRSSLAVTPEAVFTLLKASRQLRASQEKVVNVLALGDTEPQSIKVAAWSANLFN